MASVKELTSMDYIYDKWTYPFDEKNNGEPEVSHLEEPIEILREKLCACADGRDYSKLWKCYDEILHQAKKLNDYSELARVEVICALFDARYGRSALAKERLEDAIQHNITNDHFTAVAHWLSGIVDWNYEKKTADAIFEWYQCKKLFTGLSVLNGVVTKQNEWYKARILEINQFFAEIKSEDMTRTAASAEQASAQARVAAGKGAQPDNYLRLYNIYPATSAGHWTPRTIKVIGFVEVPEIQIGDRRYEVINLDQKGGNIINLLAKNEVFAIQVSGESMNVVIDNEDYVLVDPSRQNPHNGEIVFVEQYDYLDSKDTIKEFHSDGVNDVFSPNSNLPQYKKPPYPYVFKKGDRDAYHIIGTVVARLKPKP
jgi:hypothetical protein